MDSKNLFEEFPEQSQVQWEEVIKADLKGADYAKKLISKTIEGIDIKPYYTTENLKTIKHIGGQPDIYPFVRGYKSETNNWLICEDINETDINKANKLALEGISKGADAIRFNAGLVNNTEELTTLLTGIDLNSIPVHFTKSKSYTKLLDFFLEYIEKNSFNKAKVRGSFDFDALSYLLLNGDFYDSEEKIFTDALSLIKRGGQSIPEFKFININGQYFHNGGASIIEELSFSLASASEYIVKLMERDLDFDLIVSKLYFTFATGQNYFAELAKLRAFRLVWTAFAEYYKPKKDSSYRINIHSCTSQFTMTCYDPYNNILRSTIEAMSAVFGGCDMLTVYPFDSVYKKPDEFSIRIARNIQIILKNETHSDKVADPAAGAYFIESLTDSIASLTIDLFKQTEAMGGYIKAIKENFIQDRIEATLQKRKESVAKRRTTILGTNLYPNTGEKIISGIEHSVMDIGYDENKTAQAKFKALKQCRLADDYEKLRLATEKHSKAGNKPPVVFLFTVGNVTMRRARAGFSINFFGCSGYNIIDNNGFDNIDNGVKAALEANPDLVVICSSDDEYALLAPEINRKIKAVKSKIKIIVAGNLVEIKEQLLKEGIDDFISIQSNTLETLQKYNKLLGISPE
ncbi:MAG: methylmalonyl-CoA mutase small subunit [Bacteroidales bacterium]|nr:methylmalonyl-CoA mutase small subunit [Bacteroidales bacterium]